MRNLGLVITFWLASIALPTNSFALGLGEIEIDSFLNQPLNAQIEVISARPGEIDDLLVTLASRDSFKRAGLSRPRHLSELKFAVKKNESGDSAVILVTTKAAVKEPFLNFLVEADWSKGRVLREFTVLLDPPFFADTAAPAETTSQSTSSQSTTPSTLDSTPIAEEVTTSEAVAPVATSTSSTSSDEQTITEPIALSQESDSGSESEEIQTIIADESEPISVGDVQIVKGDTLWSIASQFKDSEHSMGQVMLAIQRMSPEAFGDGNINNLKIGAVLRAPSAEQMDRISKREAYADVLVQNGLWDDYVARVTGSTPVSMAGDGGTGTGGDSGTDLSDLSLLAPGDGDSDAAGLQGDGEDANQLSRKLALAEEELEASQVENSELESRIAELEATLSKVQELQKMVEIEDDSLAQLQADQAAEAAEVAAAAAEEQLAVEEKLAAEEQAVLDQALVAAKQAEQESAVETPSAQESTEEAIEEQASVTPPAPVIISEPIQESESMLGGIIPAEIADVLTGVMDLLPSLDSILADPIMLGALGGIVILLLALVLYKRRKGGDADDDMGVGEDDELTASEEEEEFTPIHLASEGGEEETNVNTPDSEDLKDDAADEDDMARTSIISQAEVAEAITQETPVVEQDDTLNEVDVYLAYGLYENAEDLLNQSLEDNPERADYRAKLLDTYFATKNVDKFAQHAETLKSMGAAADSYWDRVQAMGYELAPDNGLFSGGKDSDISIVDLGVSKPEAADFDIGAEEDSTNFSTTDFNLGEESDDFTDTQNFVETVVRKEGAELEDLPELDDEVDSGVPEAAASDESEYDSDALDFAFDAEDDAEEGSGDDGAMDFDMEEAVESDEGSSAEAEEDKVEATALIDMPDDFDATSFELDSKGDSDQASDDIDLGMDDTSLDENQLDDDEIDMDFPGDAGDSIEATALTSAVDENVVDGGDDFSLDLEDADAVDDGDHDIEATAFTGIVDEDLIGGDEGFSLDLDDDAAAMDVDLDSQPAKTDTFAPGDFDDPEELIASETDIEDVKIDDIDDLMLPDDADEVGTKLDLARAFIDMGDAEGARSSLDEVLAEGNEEQKAEATNIIKHL